MRFPRPAVLRGRDGAERYPQVQDLSLEMAVLRSLRTLDPSLTLTWVEDAIGIQEEEEVIRARNATLRERPADVRRFFESQLPRTIPSQSVVRTTGNPIRPAPHDDPYGD